MARVISMTFWPFFLSILDHWVKLVFDCPVIVIPIALELDSQNVFVVWKGSEEPCFSFVCHTSVQGHTTGPGLDAVRDIEVADAQRFCFYPPCGEACIGTVDLNASLASFKISTHGSAGG